MLLSQLLLLIGAAAFAWLLSLIGRYLGGRTMNAKTREKLADSYVEQIMNDVVNDWLPGMAWTDRFTEDEINVMVVEAIDKLVVALGEWKDEFKEDIGLAIAKPPAEYFVVINDISRDEEFTHLHKLDHETFVKKYLPPTCGGMGSIPEEGNGVEPGTASVDDEGLIVAVGCSREEAAMAFTKAMAEGSATHVDQW